MLLFLAYLLSINGIISRFVLPKNSFKRVDMNEIQSNTTPVYAVNHIEYIGGAYQFIYVQGWAFCETEGNNADKQINIVLKDTYSDKAYSYSLDRDIPQYRPDVRGHFKGTKKVYGDDHGLEAKIAVFNLPNSIYELYIHVIENKTNYGITSTGQYYEKTNDDFVFYDFTREAEVPLELTNTSSGVGNIDVVEKTENGLRVCGWASYSQETNETQKIYVRISLPDQPPVYYSTKQVYRPDVVSAFDESYANTGFECLLKLKKPDENYMIALVAGIGDQFYLLPIQRAVNTK